MKKFTRNLILAALGAAALTRKETKRFLKDLKKQGIDEKRGQKYLNQLMKDIKSSTNEIATTINRRVDAVVGNIDIGRKGGREKMATKKKSSAKGKAKKTKKRK